MATRKKKNKKEIEEPVLRLIETNQICVVKAKQFGFDSIPVLPCGDGDTITLLKEGTLVKCLDYRETMKDVYLHRMQIMTGPNSGDTVLVPSGGIHMLEDVPTR